MLMGFELEAAKNEKKKNVVLVYTNHYATTFTLVKLKKITISNTKIRSKLLHSLTIR